MPVVEATVARMQQAGLADRYGISGSAALTLLGAPKIVS
jgi:hypothetical protein